MRPSATRPRRATAIAELQTFVSAIPTRELIDEGQKYLREAKDRLGDSEYRVGVSLPLEMPIPVRSIA